MRKQSLFCDKINDWRKTLNKVRRSGGRDTGKILQKDQVVQKKQKGKVW